MSEYFLEQEDFTLGYLYQESNVTATVLLHPIHMTLIYVIHPDKTS